MENEKYRFKFIEYTDPTEVCAAYTARKVAELMRKRGIEVTIERLPYEVSLQRIMWDFANGKISAVEVERQFEDVFFERYEQLLNDPDDDSCHIIDFHNSPGYHLKTQQRWNKHSLKLRPIELVASDYYYIPSEFQELSNFNCQRLPILSPIHIDLHGHATNGRLIGTIELPAKYVKLPDNMFTLLKKARAKLFSELKRLDDPGGIGLDLYMNFFGSKKGERILWRADIKETQKAGWVSPDIFAHIADELMRLAKEEADFIRHFPEKKGTKHRIFEFWESKTAELIRNLLSQLEPQLNDLTENLQVRVNTLKQQKEEVWKEVLDRRRSGESDNKKLLRYHNRLVREIEKLEIKIEDIQKLKDPSCSRTLIREKVEKLIFS